jgi:hypothetical protein
LTTVKISDGPKELQAPLRIIGNEKALLTMEPGALLLTVRIDGVEGHYVHGKGSFALDSVVETKMGAVGRPVKRQLEEAFLVLGPFEEDPDLSPATEEEVKNAGYAGTDGLVGRAEEMCRKLAPHAEGGGNASGEGSVVIFPVEKGAHILVVKEEHIVYDGGRMKFISSGDRTVLTQGEKVVVSGTDGIVNFGMDMASAAVGVGCCGTAQEGCCTDVEDECCATDQGECTDPECCVVKVVSNTDD